MSQCAALLTENVRICSPPKLKCLFVGSTDCSLRPGGCTMSRFCICTVLLRRMWLIFTTWWLELNSRASCSHGLSSSSAALKKLDAVVLGKHAALSLHKAASHSSIAYSSATMQPVDNRLWCSMIHCGLCAQSVTLSSALYHLSPPQILQWLTHFIW